MITNTSLSDLIKKINKEMIESYLCVNRKKNPVYLYATKANSQQFLHMLIQYSWFSRKISSFFLEAFLNLSFHDRPLIVQELVQNIREELSQDEYQSSQSIKFPHYVLLRKGFQEAFSIDISEIPPSLATQLFIDSIMKLMSKTPARVAGSAYALESSAVPELELMYEFTQSAFSNFQKPIPNTIRHFFEAHINELEVGHEERLKEVCEASIHGCEKEEFELGFYSVLEIMDKWWTALSDEMDAFKMS